MNKEKKICILISVGFPSKGGYENFVYEFANALSKKVIVQVVCASSNSQESIPDNLNVYPVLKSPKIRYIGFLITMVVNPFLFYNFLRKEKPQIIHAHPSIPCGFITIPAKLLDIPVICTSHGDDIQINRECGYGARRNLVLAKLVNLILKHSSLHTVVSKSMIKDAIEAGSHPSKIRVVYNGVNLEQISSFGETNIVQQYKINKNDFIVLFVGRLHPIKCPHDLVTAFPKVIEKVPNAKLIIAGAGKEEIKLRKLVSDLNLEDRVIFAGYVSGDKKWDLLRGCKVLVLPSVVEAFGIALIEAMACSKPVIATNIGPFSEIIKNGETGLLVPLHAPDELANAIIELALDEKKRKRMGEMARKEVEERFDINKIADDYLEIYDELIKKFKKVS